MQVKVKDNQVIEVGLPEIGTLSDGRTVSGYNMLDAELLRAEGWMPLEHDMPEHDLVTQMLRFDMYDIQADKVVARFVVVDVPATEPSEPPEPTTDEVLGELIELLVDKGVIY